MTYEIFDNIKYFDGGNDGNGGDDSQEYWFARDIQIALEYKDWRNFLAVINKAKIACENSDINPFDHFVDVTKMVQLGSGSQREVDDIILSRYACYLILQNADPRKPVVAIGQTYFAIQTRRQEIEDQEFELLSDDEKRLKLRGEMKTHNKMLAAAAKDAGVKTPLEYAIFQNYGYKGLYGGLDNKAIKAKKGISPKKDLLDHIGSTELAANLFRATQTEEKLKRENIQGKDKANATHLEVGCKVRQTIKELGGTMPEDLPVHEDIKKLERKQKKLKELG